MTIDAFIKLIVPITQFIGEQPLDHELEKKLNTQFPAHSATFQAILQACIDAIQAGWMCHQEHGGIKFGRVAKPSDALMGFSVDVVDMNTVIGPHHRHPHGEVNMIMPLDEKAQFDGHSMGWCVYPPDSTHCPTTSGGRVLIVYLLPQGAIEFTRKPA